MYEKKSRQKATQKWKVAQMRLLKEMENKLIILPDQGE